VTQTFKGKIPKVLMTVQSVSRNISSQRVDYVVSSRGRQRFESCMVCNYLLHRTIDSLGFSPHPHPLSNHSYHVASYSRRYLEKKRYTEPLAK
jgi:hypothetical protein